MQSNKYQKFFDQQLGQAAQPDQPENNVLPKLFNILYNISAILKRKLSNLRRH
jgi:hypothetical protein